MFCDQREIEFVTICFGPNMELPSIPGMHGVLYADFDPVVSELLHASWELHSGNLELEPQVLEHLVFGLIAEGWKRFAERARILEKPYTSDSMHVDGIRLEWIMSGQDEAVILGCPIDEESVLRFALRRIRDKEQKPAWIRNSLQHLVCAAFVYGWRANFLASQPKEVLAVA